MWRNKEKHESGTVQGRVINSSKASIITLKNEQNRSLKGKTNHMSNYFFYRKVYIAL